MIVARDRDGLVLVRQVDHQEQCGLMAGAWGNAEFARPEPFGPVRDAAAHHDEGWRPWEAAPRAAAGAPVNFTDMERATHVAIYHACIAGARARDPREGLLVSMHGQGLYEYTPPARRDPLARAFIAEQEALQGELMRELGGGADLAGWASAAYRLVRAWDALSLYLTWRGLREGRPGVLRDVPRRPGERGVDLDLSPDGPMACFLDALAVLAGGGRASGARPAHRGPPLRGRRRPRAGAGAGAVGDPRLQGAAGRRERRPAAHGGAGQSSWYLNETERRARYWSMEPSSLMVTSCSTTSATRRSRRVLDAVAIAAAVASSHELSLVPTISITL